MAEMSISQALQLGLQHQLAGRAEQAESIYRQILARQRHPDALHLLGLLEGQRGRLAEAIDLVNHAIAAAPQTAIYRVNMAKFLSDAGRFEEAAASCEAALRSDARSAEAYSNLAVAQKNLGRLGEAEQACREAIRLKPGYGEAQINLGNILKTQGRLVEAIECYDEVLRDNPDYAEAHFNCGVALFSSGRLDEAVEAYERALALKPGFADAYNFLGNTRGAQGRVEEAVACFRKAMELNPNSAVFASNLLLALNYLPAADGRMLHEESVTWGRRYGDPLRSSVAHANSRDAERRLRIGYVSADFRGHPVGRFLLPFMRHHDRGQFEVHCYSDTVSGDGMTAALRACASGWHEIAGRSDEVVAAMMRQHGIDILVDLAGHTSGNRLLVFARKPAPVQVSYLGYPATTGMAAMDYRLTDALSDLPGLTEKFYSEKLWRLAACNWCYMPPEDAPEIAPALASSGLVTFGSFNNFAKVSAETLDLWTQILESVPDSRLVLKSLGLENASVRQDIHQKFAGRGIDPARVELLGWLREQGSALGAYERLDIALDTFPYHGTTTTCEALWMGVPVITLAGASHVSRVGVSLLTNAGLPELIAQRPHEYVTLAMHLAADRARREEIRRTLRERMRPSPLMDAVRFARDVEYAYREMWRTWCNRTH